MTDGEGNTTTTIIKDGKNAEAEVKTTATVPTL
ncbi:hypothetical protein [Neisseria subflava]